MSIFGSTGNLFPAATMNILPSESETDSGLTRLDSFNGLGPKDPSDHEPFHVVCAWCKGTLPRRAREDALDGVSHGICRPCASRHFGVELPGAA